MHQHFVWIPCTPPGIVAYNVWPHEDSEPPPPFLGPDGCGAYCFNHGGLADTPLMFLQLDSVEHTSYLSGTGKLSSGRGGLNWRSWPPRSPPLRPQCRLCHFNSQQRFCFHEWCLSQPVFRRESERRNHSLARHADILAAVETRLSLLNMTFMKYVDSNLCCFIPGKVGSVLCSTSGRVLPGCSSVFTSLLCVFR